MNWTCQMRVDFATFTSFLAGILFVYVCGVFLAVRKVAKKRGIWVP